MKSFLETNKPNRGKQENKIDDNLSNALFLPTIFKI